MKLHDRSQALKNPRGAMLLLLLAYLCILSIPAEAAVFRTRLLDKGPFAVGSTFRVEVQIEDNATTLSTYAIGVVYTSETLLLLPKAHGIKFNRTDFRLNDCSLPRVTAAGRAHMNFAGISPLGAPPNVHLFTLHFRVQSTDSEASIQLDAMRPGVIPLHDTTLPEPQPIEARFDFKATERIPLPRRGAPVQPPKAPSP
jgi:hypothetical protein